MKKPSNQSFLDYLYKFINLSGLLIKKEKLKGILLSYNIIDDINYNLNISREGFKFINLDNLNNLEYPRLINDYTNKVMNNHKGIVSKQIIIMIKQTFYYIFLNENIIKRNGYPTNDAFSNKKANIFHCFPSNNTQANLTIDELYNYLPRLKQYNNHKNIIRDNSGLYYLNTLFIKELFEEFEITFNNYKANNNFDLSMVKNNYKDYIDYFNKSMTKELSLLMDMKDYIEIGNYNTDFNKLNELESLLHDRQSISQDILNKELKYISNSIPKLK